MPLHLTDGLILGALLTIIAWLFARAVALVLFGMRGSEAASVNRSGGGKASGKADRLVGNGSHNHRGGGL